MRHGKSELTSFWTPTWFLNEHPYRKAILTAYEQDFAASWGRRVRDEIETHRGTLSVRIRRDSNAAHRWNTTEGGGMFCTGAGGPLTGKGADLLIIDDPIKNHVEAESKTHREKLWSWFRSVVYTRLEPGAAIILTMARWHEDDLVGRILKGALEEDAEPWRVVNLPALAEPDDPLGRSCYPCPECKAKPSDRKTCRTCQGMLWIGEALWPERRSRKDLLRIRKAVGEYYFNALYQQRPSAPDGTIFKRHWWRLYTTLPWKFDLLLQSWDMAFVGNDDSSYVVGQLWGKLGGDLYLIDQIRAQMNYPETKVALRAFHAKHRDRHAASHTLIENKANGPAIMADLQGIVPGMIAVEPFGDKVARARAASGPVEAGNVYIPDPSIAPWVSDFLDEAAKFPKAEHDDQVDATSQAITRLSGLPIADPDAYATVRG